MPKLEQFSEGKGKAKDTTQKDPTKTFLNDRSQLLT